MWIKVPVPEKNPFFFNRRIFSIPYIPANSDSCDLHLKIFFPDLTSFHELPFISETSSSFTPKINTVQYNTIQHNTITPHLHLLIRLLFYYDILGNEIKQWKYQDIVTICWDIMGAFVVSCKSTLKPACILFLFLFH